MIKVGIVGSTGYAGNQLVSIILRHPEVELVFVSSHSYVDEAYADIFPSLKNQINTKCINMHSAHKNLSNIDVLFIALPHGKSFELVQEAYNLGVRVIDLGADFRLKDAGIYQQWYGLEHQSPDLIANSVYGLPELNRSEIKGSRIIANPGCYPTASLLGIAPLLANDIIDERSLILDGKSGISGAGRSANPIIQYAECNESINAYGVATHRHTPEIEQELGKLIQKDLTLQFTPHRIPMTRGILMTIYCKAKEATSTEALLAIYEKFYKTDYFVRVSDNIPETRHVKHSNFCDISVRYDDRTNNIIIMSVIDNLMKGAASQAVQNMNIMFDLEEETGIDFLPVYP